MKIPITFLCIFLCIVVTAQTISDSVKRYDPTQLREDWDTLYAQLQSNHPTLYAQWSKKDADKAFNKYRSKLKKPLTKSEFDRLARLFIAGFQDGHTYVNIDFEDKAFVDYGKNGGRLFPIGVVILDERLFCSDTSSINTSIPVGAEIVSINDRSAKEVIQILTSMQSADNKRSNYSITQWLFGYSMWNTFGWGQKTKIVFLNNGKKESILVDGVPTSDYITIVFGTNPEHQLHIYSDLQLAVLQIDSYDNLKASRVFIDSSFQVIKEKGIKHVALDLRRNGGGNSKIGDMVLAYITKKPYVAVSSKTWLDGPLLQSVSKENWRYKTLNEVRTGWKLVGSNRYQKQFGPHLPDSLSHPEWFTTAKFYLLTSGRTYSSAHMTALSVKCFKLGTIIGQPTGERLNLTGELTGFVLPHTKLSIGVPTAVFTSACGIGSQVGVQPDHYIPLRVKDIKEGRDAELTFLKELIEKENKQLAKK